MKKMVLGICLIVAFLAGVIVQPVGAAESQLCQDLRNRTDLTQAEKNSLLQMSGCSLTDQDTADKMANKIIEIVLSVIGVLAVGVMIYGGIMYIISTGDAAKVNRAKHIIMYGLIGLVISLLAYMIVQFVIKSVTG